METPAGTNLTDEQWARVAAYLPLVRSTSKRFRGYGGEVVYDWAMQYLIRAAEQFDPRCNVPFGVYAKKAMCWAIASAGRCIIRDIVKISETTVDPTVPEPTRLDRFERETVHVALQMLSVPHRDVILLRYFMGRNVSEAARELGVNPSTVTRRERRALFELREALEMDCMTNED